MRNKVVVEIRGGTLVGLYSSAPGVEAFVVDWDDIKDAPREYSASYPSAPLEDMPRETRERVEISSPHEADRSPDGT